MNEADFFQAQLEEYRRGFEAGRYPEAVKALLLCAWNSLPIPDWVADEAETAMTFYFAKGGAEGRGKKGGVRAQYIRDQDHRQRHHMAEWELARRASEGGTRADAFQRASDRLSGKRAWGSAEQVERSYNKIQKEYRGK